MFHKIKAVSPLPGLRLLVHFAEGSAKEYDVNPLADRMDVFRRLKEIPGLFACAAVDPGGYGISWDDDTDLDCEELWANGKPVQTPFDGLLAFSDATAIWNLNESTLRKAVSYGKLQNGRDVMKFGKQWLVTKTAMLREYGQPI